MMQDSVYRCTQLLNIEAENGSFHVSSELIASIQRKIEIDSIFKDSIVFV